MFFTIWFKIKFEKKKENIFLEKPSFIFFHFRSNQTQPSLTHYSFYNDLSSHLIDHMTSHSSNYAPRLSRNFAIGTTKSTFSCRSSIKMHLACKLKTLITILISYNFRLYSTYHFTNCKQHTSIQTIIRSITKRFRSLIK